MERELFVGRRAELAELAAVISATQTGRGRIVLCTGEPGIGKTRLARAITARAEGARVVWGSAWDGGGAPGYWPWMQIVKRLVDAADAAALWRDLGPMAQHLERLAASPDAAAAHAAPADAEGAARFALFETVATLLRRAAAERVLVVVLDDLHAADVPSLLLLEFVARELGDAALLVVGTYRDTDMERDPTRAAPLARVARQALHLRLTGWREGDVAEFIAAAIGQHPTPELTAAVHHLTAGNPFYVVEIVRQLVAQHAGVLPAALPDATPLPASVRGFIRERLRPLPAGCLALLRVASVIGRAFDVALLSEVSGVPAPAALASLADTVAVGALVACRAAPPTWAFSHDLIRAALYEDLRAAERPRLHHAVGTALARRHGTQTGVHLAELAHHFWHGAAAGGDLETALAYAQQAARDAATRLAFEAAVARYEDALELLARVRPGDGAARAALLIELGAVRGRIASGAGRPAFQAAAAAAQAAGAPVLLALAALGFADRGLGVPHRAPDSAAVALLDAALAALPAAETALRARVLARVSVELAVSDDRGRGDALSAAAVELARGVADPAALAHVLSARHFVLWRWDARADHAALATEVVRLANQVGDADLEMQGRTWLAFDLMRAGAAAELDLEIEAYARLAERIPHPRWRWMTANLRAVRALWRGAFAAAEQHIGEAVAATARIDDESARLNPLIQRFALRREQGRLAEEEPMARLSAARAPNSPVPRTFLAFLLCELGRVDDARPLFESLAVEDFDDLERDRRIGVLPYLAEVCAALGDARRAVRLSALLRPHAETVLPYGASLCFGSGEHFLALLAVARVDLDAAAPHFERALVLHARMDAPPWLARTQLAYAGMLTGRGRAGDRAHAERLRGAALDTARALGMQALLDRAGAHGVARPRRIVPAPGPPRRAAAAGVFRREGRRWSIGDGGVPVRLKDSKGLRYLAHLLDHPGREIHVTELVGRAAADGAARQAGAMAYARRRLEALRDALEEATRFNDVGRAARARVQIELAGDALAQRVGLGGRGQPAAAPAERARLNVSRTIADAVRRIAAENPALGRYFETTIKTGAFCSFTPDPRVPIDWQLI